MYQENLLENKLKEMKRKINLPFRREEEFVLFSVRRSKLKLL